MTNIEEAGRVLADTLIRCRSTVRTDPETTAAVLVSAVRQLAEDAEDRPPARYRRETLDALRRRATAALRLP